MARAGEAGLRLPVLLVFGQVDAEFVFTFRRLAKDPPAPFDEQAFIGFCEDTAEHYAEFAASLPQLGRPAWLAGILPPALSDAAWRAGYLNAHIASAHGGLPLEVLADRLKRADPPSLIDRVRHHQGFNRALESAARRRGLGFLDVAATLPMSGGAPEPDLLGPPARRDHHLDYSALGAYIRPALWRLVRESGVVSE
jgi:hypothetical protein